MSCNVPAVLDEVYGPRSCCIISTDMPSEACLLALLCRAVNDMTAICLFPNSSHHIACKRSAHSLGREAKPSQTLLYVWVGN